MGNTFNCTQIDTRFQCDSLVDESQRKKPKQIQDARFGLIEVVEEAEKSQRRYVKERIIRLSFDALEELKFRSQLSHQNLLRIYDWTQILNDDGGKIRVQFESFNGDFQQEISQAIESNCRFNEATLTNVLRSAVKALCYLQEQNISHQNIIPRQILKVGNAYKLHDNYTINDTETLYDQAKRNENLRYLAPELHSYYFEKAQVTPDLFKADVFSLGMVIFDAALLNDSDDEIVDNIEKMILEQNLQSRLSHFKSIFPNLSQIVSEMLEFDPSKRPNPLNLLERLNQPEKREKRRKIALSQRQVLQLKRSNSPKNKKVPSPKHHIESSSSKVAQNGFSGSHVRVSFLNQNDANEPQLNVRTPKEHGKNLSILGSERSECNASKHTRAFAE